MGDLYFICGSCREIVSEMSLELSQLRVSSVRESVKIGLEPGGRGVAIVGAAIRKRLVTD
jgi:hypothetical protein